MRRWLGPLGLVAPVLFLLVYLFPPSCSGERLPLPRLAQAQERQLRAWLKERGKSPEEYVVSKFEDHDVVFLGEYHRIRHDPLLVQALIPVLHAHGVRNLGLEFALARDQSLIDSLLSAPAYDEQVANRVFWNQWPWWGYQEYVDILRAAWRLNRSLPPDATPFRVLGLNAPGDWSRVWSQEDLRNPEIRKTIRPEGSYDSVMAATILREIVGRHEKGLVYSGIFHAFTCFHQPYPGGPGQPVQFNTDRMGNRVYAAIGKRCCTLYLHAPWIGAGGYDDQDVYPSRLSPGGVLRRVDLPGAAAAVRGGARRGWMVQRTEPARRHRPDRQSRSAREEPGPHGAGPDRGPGRGHRLSTEVRAAAVTVAAA